MNSEPLDRFYTVSQKHGNKYQGYIVEVGSNKFWFGERKALADRFAAILRQATEAEEAARFKFPSKARTTSKDIADQLTKLGDLRKNNLITEDEFNAAKRKLLD